MKSYFEQLLIDVNKAVIKMRGAYALWCKKRGLNYHELLIWYSLRDFGTCTQKQICEQYLLPKQTIHNIVTALQKKGLVHLEPCPDNWKEKTIVMTDEGRAYYDSIMTPLMEIEEQVVACMGKDDLRMMTDLAMHYGEILEKGLVNQS